MSTSIEISLPRQLTDIQRRSLTQGLGSFVIVAVVLQVAHVLFVLSGGLDRVAGFLPDDACYYFKMAANFARSGHWTFDGTAPATGFHLLWGYFWAAVFTLAPHLSVIGIYLLSFAVGLACYLLAATALWMLVVEYDGSEAILAVFALFLGSSLFMLPALAMESGPTLLCASLAFLLLFGPRPLERSRWQWVALYAVGLFGMLSRSDFGLLVFSSLLAQFLDAAIRKNLTVRAVLPSLVCMAGAMTGLAIVLTHSWVVGGHLFQASAQTKYYWSSLNGHSLMAPLLLLAASLVYKLPLAGILMYPVLVGLIVVAAIGFNRVVKFRLPTLPLLAAALTVAGYVALYSRDSRALQLWYAASFGAPLTIICAPGLTAIAVNYRTSTRVLVGVAVAVTFAVSLRPAWPHQFAMKDAGLFLAAHPQVQPVGAWNAGLLGYFAGRPVTNLDGLVNDDILAYAKSGTLAEYVRKRRLAYIIDSSAMFGPDLALRGGYADGKLRSCLQPVQQIDAERAESHWQDGVLTLYKVDASCLESSSGGRAARAAE
jgi:hypothetical protein